MPDDEADHPATLIHEGVHALRRGTRVLADFKTFITKGSALDLAIGVVIGAAFNSVVTSLVKDVLSPIVSWPGRVDFSRYGSCLKSVRGHCLVHLNYGSFITSVISFLITAAAVFFFVVRPINQMRAWRRDGEQEPQMQTCPECLSEIPKEAIRCRACTIKLPASKPRSRSRGRSAERARSR
jgi:large conductance mechanosensitive channel